jgi:hypothetical protein
LQNAAAWGWVSACCGYSTTLKVLAQADRVRAVPAGGSHGWPP